MGLGALGLLDGDDALFADLLHGLGNELANLVVVIGGDCSDLLDLLVGVVDLLSLSLDALYDLGHGLVDAPLEIHGVGAGGDVLDAGVHDGLREYGRGCRAVASVIARLGGDLLDHLRAEVGVRVGELDLLGHGDAVLSNVGRTELALDHDIATLGTEGYLDGVGKLVDTFFEELARLGIEFNGLCHNVLFLKK